MAYNLELDRQGGRFNAEVGMLLGAADLDNMGGMAMQSLLHTLMLLFYDRARGTPITGFPRDIAGGDHCKVVSTGDLSFDVQAGWGLYFNSGAIGGDEFGADAYRPIVVEADDSRSLAAHDGSNPRYDIVCLAPAWADDQSATRNVKDPVSGVISSSSVNQRRRFSYALQVVTGTPAATPTVPATPAGYVRIAIARVPATSGAAVWSDDRPVLSVGQLLQGAPHVDAAGDFVLGGDGSGELAVSATSPAAMAVDVATGRAAIGGQIRRYTQRVSLAVTASHASLDRIDRVVAYDDATIAVVAGNPGGSAPAIPADAISLALIAVAATVTTITAGDITDTREWAPYGNEHIKPGSVNHNRLSVPTVLPVLSVSGSGDTRTIAIDLKYPDGVTDWDGELGVGNAEFLAEIYIDTSGPLYGGGVWPGGVTGSTIFRLLDQGDAGSGADGLALATSQDTVHVQTGQDGDTTPELGEGTSPLYFAIDGANPEIQVLRPISESTVIDAYVIVRPVGILGAPSLPVKVSFT